LLATAQLTGQFNYQVVMINGQPVQQGILSIQNGGKYEIPLNGKVLPGTYALRVADQSQSFYFKLLIQ